MSLAWIAIAADLLIAFCYFAIPLVLVRIASWREERDWLSRALYGTSIFVGVCGAVHVCDVVAFWWSIHLAQTVVKVAAGGASIVTLGALLRTSSAIRSAKTDSQVRKLVEERTKMLEEQAHVRKMAEQSVRLEVERIMRELAHDLKEPARAIASFTEIVLDQEDLPEERKRDFLDRANKGAHRIIDMIQEMRSYALATAGNRNGSIEMVPFHRVVDEALGRVDRKIELTEAHIERAIEVSDKSLVAESVVRVIQNLVENSIKYSLKGQAPKIWLSATEKDGSVLVEIRDAGMGFDALSAGHIFEPFHRLKPHDDKPGVGMGLAISNNIVTKIGGRIWAQSDGEGKGATVFFRVPTEREGDDAGREQDE